jgi:tetratricopeptide (TPR) repeat protein
MNPARVNQIIITTSMQTPTSKTPPLSTAVSHSSPSCRKNAFYSFEPPEYPDERPKIMELAEEEGGGGSADEAAAASVSEQGIAACKAAKEEGNACYKAGDYLAALAHYSEAIKAMREAVGAPAAAEEEADGEWRVGRHRRRTRTEGGDGKGAGVGERAGEAWLQCGGEGLRAEYARIRSNMGECCLKTGDHVRAVAECSAAVQVSCMR